MEVARMSTTTKATQSFSGINMFKTKRNELTRTASRDLGCYDGDRCSPLPQDDEVDTILMQLEGGLIGAKDDIVKITNNYSSSGTSGCHPSGSYFPFQRKCKKQVDREQSDQSMDPDQFLWNSSSTHENAPSIPTK